MVAADVLACGVRRAYTPRVGTQQPPSPTTVGWFPSPDGAPVLRWWNGHTWADRTVPLPAPGLPSPPVAIPKPLGGIALATRIGIAVTAAVALAGLARELFGMRAMAAYVDGTGPLADLETYDLLGTIQSPVQSATVLVSGILWMVWQYRAAVRFGPYVLMRSPEWHVASWIIPIVWLWFPYENIADLWRAAGQRRPAWLPVWWAAWLGTPLLNAVGGMIVRQAEALDGFWVAARFYAASCSLTIVAAPMAWLVVTQLTRALNGLPQHGAATEQRPRTLG